MCPRFIKTTSCLVFLLWVALGWASDIYFSPKSGAQGRIVKEIDAAQRSIDIAMYSFTSRPIAQALVRAKDRGLVIRIIMDRLQAAGKYSKSRYLIKRGFQVKIPKISGLMHHKFAIIDNRLLLTGSYNWTASAEVKNKENLMVIYDPQVIMVFQDEFISLVK